MTKSGFGDGVLDRLQVATAVLPVVFIAVLVVAISSLGLPVWADVVLGATISLPFVVGFGFIVFTIVGKLHDELVRREARFRELLESAPDAIVIVDASGTIVMVNDQSTQVFGYAREELIGQPVEQLLPEQLRAGHGQHRADYHRAPSRRPMGVGLELTARRKDGTLFPAEISLSPIDSDEGMLVTSVIRDITERRQMEEERKGLIAQHEAERERERIGMDLHDGVIQSIYAVGLNLEAAAEDVSERPEEVRGRLDRAIEQLNDTISDIRSYIFQLRPSRLDGNLHESLAHLAEEFRVNSLVEVELELAAELPALAADGRSALFHIAQEALNNVRKHARATVATITVEERGELVRLTVRDNGAGFDPSREPTEEHRGLRNMASRARAAGGTLSVESGTGGGTSVRFEIPAAAVAAGETR
ncbi:MAG TPA: PAS domain S-box protein [Dehalococcoidia bacterium]|nr:PAS domain S-box protein [Dehalococcoidia bacterium]